MPENSWSFGSAKRRERQLRIHKLITIGDMSINGNKGLVTSATYSESGSDVSASSGIRVSIWQILTYYTQNL
jgi:hypothetical protein